MSKMIATDQGFVSEQHQRIAEVLNDYNPELALVWIPPAMRETAHDREYPFAVMHFPAFGEPYIVKYVRENELDHRLIAEIWARDQSKHPNLKQKIMLENAAARAMELKEQAERLDEMAEVHTALLKSPKHTWRGPNGKVYS